jgi:beta-lactamase class A
MEGKTKAGFIFISISLFFFAGVLFFISIQEYQKQSQIIPSDSTVGPFSIGGLEISQALVEPKTFFQQPVMLSYQDQLIQVSPEIFDFHLDLNSLESDLKSQMENIYSNKNFFPYLFGKFHAEPIHLELKMSWSQQKIRDYLINEIVPRYDKPAKAKQPILNGSGFLAGEIGFTLDIDSSIQTIEKALVSVESRFAVLSVTRIDEPKAIINNLETQLKQLIDQIQEQGQITEVVLIDPSTGDTFDFARQNLKDVPPEISFTAASTIKIPIMISSFRIMDEEPEATTKKQLSLMITESKNEQTDWMMENIIGGNLAPLTVTDDMRKLGYKNIFLAGYFYLGAPLLDIIETPANTRTDINLKPDMYNQTTAKDMTNLLFDLYQCSQDGSGKLTEVFPKKITQTECSSMIDLLKRNHLPYLISAGVPDGTVVAHKHGWIEESDGLLHTMSNVGIVYTPNGDYILGIYTYHPENLIFEEGNKLFTQISAAVYGYFVPISENSSE